MAKTLTFKGSTYTYKVVVPDSLTANSENLGNEIPLPTSTVSPKVTSETIRYLKIASASYDTSYGVFQTIDYYKIVYPKNSTTGVVSNIVPVNDSTTYGAIAQFNFYLGNSSLSMPMFAEMSVSKISDPFSTSSYQATFNADLPPTLNLTYSYNSSINSIFGNVDGFCTFSVNAVSYSYWVYGDTVPKSIPINRMSDYDKLEIRIGPVVGAKEWTSPHSADPGDQGGVSLSMNNITTELFNAYPDTVKGVRATNAARCVKNTPIRPSIQSYTAPTISNLKVSRFSNRNAKIELAYTLDSLNKQSTESSDITINSVTANYQIKNSNGVIVKEGTADIYSEGQSTTSLSNTFSFTTTGDDFDEETSYMAYVWVTDRLGQSSQTLSTILPTDYRTLDFLAGGRGIAMGKVSNEEGLHCAMESRFDDPNIYLANLEDATSIDKTFYDTAINYGFPSRPSSSININLRSHGTWVDSGETVNDAIVYKSNDSWHSRREWDTAKIEITGYDTFSIYIRSYAQGIYDYVLVSAIDSDYLATRVSTSTMRSSYSDTSRTKAYTRGKQSPDEYEKVTFDNLGGTSHYFYIIYQKNESVNENDDRGYFYLDPKNKPYIDQKKWNLKELLISLMSKATVESQTITTYESGWSYYKNSTTNQPKLRVFGKIVNLKGVMTNTASKTLNATATTIFHIPTDYAPNDHAVIAVMQGSDSNRFMASVTTAGEVQFGRYTNGTSYSAQSAGKWFPFDLTWIID